MSRLHGITVQFGNRDKEFFALRDLFRKLELVNTFNKASNFHVTYNNNNVPEVGMVVEAPMVGSLRVERERSCQINLDASYWIHVKQEGSAVTLNTFTNERTGAEQFFADGKVKDLNGNTISRNGAEDYRNLVAVLDSIPQILGWNPR